ncbi:MAG: Hsp20/alpha crystallin family protein [Flavobacterium sp.]
MDSLIKKSHFPSLMNPFIEDAFGKDILDWNNRTFAAIESTLPSVNLKETERNFEVELAAPGLRKEDFKVEIDHDVLVISSEKKQEKEEKDKKGNYTRKEFSYTSFSRAFHLPENVDENKVEANYKDGILHIDIAKKHPDKKPSTKTIQIK